MPGSCNSLDDDDDAAKLMPRVAKLIREDHSCSLESNGSTPMSLCGTSRKQRAEAVLRDVANKFLRKGAVSKQSIGACKRPLALDMLRTYCRRNVHVSEKENLRPKALTLVKQDALPVVQQKSAMRDTSLKAARELRKNRSVVKLGQRRTVNSKIEGADKSCTRIARPEHLATHAATVTSPTASHSTQGSERSCYVSSFAAKSRRGKVKIYTKTTPLSLSELQEEFAQLDGEALEEEEVSIAHLTATRPVLAPETALQHADDILENVVENRKDLSGNVNGREDEVDTALNPDIVKDTIPIYSHGHTQEGTDPGNTLSKAFISSQGSKRSSQFSSKVAAQQQLDVKLHRKGTDLEPSDQHNMRVDQVDIETKEGFSVYPTLKKPILHSGVVSQHADGDKPDIVVCPDGGNLPHFEDPGSPSVNRMEDKASAHSARVGARSRTADTIISAIPLDASAQEFSLKGTSVCAVLLELGNAESSCNNKRGHSPSKPNEENFKETTVDGPDGNASNREDVLGHKSMFRRDLQSAPSKAKRPSKQEGVSDVPLQEGTHSTRGTSATPPCSLLKLACRIHYNRTRSTDMSQRRLMFDSSSGSLSRHKVVDRNTHDASVSSVEFKSKINPAIGVLIPDVPEDDVNMTSIPHQEAIKLQITNIDEVVGHVDDKGCTSQSSKSMAAAHCEDVITKETPLPGSLEQDHYNPPVADVTSHHVTDGCALNQKIPVTGSLADDSLPAFEASKGVVGADPGIHSLGPQAGPATEVPENRGLCKRTWSNLGDPIDGGSEWKKGRRVSTRIKSRPLDWWRGERMLYGRVHRTLCTLIGIKTTSPDPIWPRPKPQRGDYNERNFHVDSFVGDSHRDLLRLAAQ